MSTSTSPKLLAEWAPTTRSTCGVCALSTDVRSQVERARAGNPKRFTYRVISEWLKAEHAIQIHMDAIRRHMTTHYRPPSNAFKD